MSVLKYIAIGILLISVSFALDVTMPANVNLSQGETKDVQIQLQNYNSDNTVGMSVVSGNLTVPVMLSSYLIDMSANTNATVTATINAGDSKPGNYTVRIIFVSNVDDYAFSRNIVVTIRETLDVRPVYSYVRVMQGDYTTFKFIIVNYGKSARSVVIDPNSLPEAFDTQYPDMFYLDPGQSKTISIKATIPSDYRPDLYSITIIALSGEAKVESVPFDLSIGKTSDYKNVVMISGLDVGGATDKDGHKGYNVMLRVENRKDETLTGVEVAGFLLGWNVTGETPFDIGPNSVKDINVFVIPTDFSDYTLNIMLVRDNLVLANTSVIFSGARAGLTGQAFLGGSLTIGLLLIVIASLVLLYVRQRNKTADESEITGRLGYLKDLVEEARKRL
jgi:hypothetical protein